MDFLKEFNERKDRVEDILKEYLPKRDSYQNTVIEACEYSLLAGGKRIRPVILMESYKLFGGKDIDGIAAFMAALECIHTYSLVHDDLPAMDNDEYRRGKKTTHVVYGEDMAILAGDGLLNYAYELMSSACISYAEKNRDIYGERAYENPVKAMATLAKKAGIYGMVGGQVADVELTGKELKKEELDFIYINKTSALLEASFMLGAILANADEDDINLLEEAGRKLGMAFQIQDDILDITGDSAELGKPVHSDEDNEKNTYAVIYGLEKSKKDVEDYSHQAIEIVDRISKKYGQEENGFLANLIESLIYRKK